MGGKPRRYVKMVAHRQSLGLYRLREDVDEPGAPSVLLEDWPGPEVPVGESRVVRVYVERGR